MQSMKWSNVWEREAGIWPSFTFPWIHQWLKALIMGVLSQFISQRHHHLNHKPRPSPSKLHCMAQSTGTNLGIAPPPWHYWSPGTVCKSTLKKSEPCSVECTSSRRIWQQAGSLIFPSWIPDLENSKDTPDYLCCAWEPHKEECGVTQPWVPVSGDPDFTHFCCTLAVSVPNTFFPFRNWSLSIPTAPFP